MRTIALSLPILDTLRGVLAAPNRKPPLRGAAADANCVESGYCAVCKFPEGVLSQFGLQNQPERRGHLANTQWFAEGLSLDKPFSTGDLILNGGFRVIVLTTPCTSARDSTRTCWPGFNSTSGPCGNSAVRGALEGGPLGAYECALTGDGCVIPVLLSQSRQMQTWPRSRARVTETIQGRARAECSLPASDSAWTHRQRPDSGMA
jgi:hypothetical protein